MKDRVTYNHRPVSQSPPTRTMTVRGHKFKVYSIGWLAYLTKRCPDTVRRWERLGALPRPIFAIPDDMTRWYTAAELRGYMAIYKKANVRRRVSIEDTSFKLDAQRFRIALLQQFKLDPTVVGSVLQNEEQTAKLIKAAQQESKRRIWQKRIDSIVEGVI